MTTSTINMAAIEVRNLFPTPLIIYPLPAAEALNAQLHMLIKQEMANTPSVAKSNRHGWQSKDDFFVWSKEPGQIIKQTATQLVQEITRTYVPGTYNLQPYNGDWRVNGWANVNYKGASNAPHTHPGCFWSGVYYVDTGVASAEEREKGGKLELLDPRGPAPLMYAPTLRIALKGCISAGAVEHYQPRAGDMVLFPSWLVHAVTEHLADSTRISIAFNFSV